jgi:predicted RNA binding protein YcfA (HicA-like mRNA interferase family)
MPRLPVVSGHDLIDALQRLGFDRARQKGSHVIMRRGPKGCSVPLHRELKRGTLAAIIEQAGVTAEQLIEVLRR